jgi:hypothetical protein
VQIKQPDYMHLQLRDGIMLQSVISYISQYFGRPTGRVKVFDPSFGVLWYVNDALKILV